MPNQYKNKVVYGDSVLMDITDTTAVASDVASGKKFYAADGSPQTGTYIPSGTDTSDTTATPADVMIGKSFYDANGDKVYGAVIPEAGNAFYVTYSQDSHGGTVTQITGVDISDSTISSETVLDGYIGYNATGQKVIGSARGGTITQDQDGALVFSDKGSYRGTSVGSITGIGNNMPETFDVNIRNINQAPTEDIVINFPYSHLNMGSIFYNIATGPNGKIKLTINAKTTPYTANGLGSNNMDTICYGSTAVREVEFNITGRDFVQLGTYSFQTTSAKGANSVEVISGTPISLRSHLGTAYTCFKYCYALTEVRFYENSSNPASGKSLYFDTCSGFSDATLVSLANGLHVPDSGVSLSLALHATPKARLSTITGFVGSVTRDEETYDKFVADANGNVTLQDFITTTKGWTIA